MERDCTARIAGTCRAGYILRATTSSESGPSVIREPLPSSTNTRTLLLRVCENAARLNAALRSGRAALFDASGGEFSGSNRRVTPRVEPVTTSRVKIKSKVHAHQVPTPSTLQSIPSEQAHSVGTHQLVPARWQWLAKRDGDGIGSSSLLSEGRW